LKAYHKIIEEIKNIDSDGKEHWTAREPYQKFWVTLNIAILSLLLNELKKSMQKQRK